MADTILRSEFMTRLASIADAHGVKITSIDDRTLKGTQRGTRVSVSRTDKGVGGGGHLDYGALRGAFEQAVRADGWQFTVEIKMP